MFGRKAKAMQVPCSANKRRIQESDLRAVAACGFVSLFLAFHYMRWIGICKNSGIFDEQILIQNTGRLNVFFRRPCFVLQHGFPFGSLHMPLLDGVRSYGANNIRPSESFQTACGFISLLIA